MSKLEFSVSVTAGTRTRIYDSQGQLVGPFATLALDEHEAALVWWALYLTYGNEDRALRLWNKFRDAVGEDRFGAVVRAGGKIGRDHRVEVHPKQTPSPKEPSHE